MKKLLTCLTLIYSVASMTQTTWYEISSGVNQQLNTISFGSSSVGYIGGNDSTLLKSIDGGKTWSSVNFTGVAFLPSGEHIVNLKFTSELIGYMTVGPYYGAYKTTDGGLTWAEITFAGNMCYNQGMYFWDADNGVFGGSGCFQGEYVETYAAGTLTPSTVNTASWDAQDVILDIDFLNSNFGLAVSQSRFLRTTDGGATWDTIPKGVTHNLTSIEIINDTLAYAGYEETTNVGFGAMVTHDGGLTWSEEVNMATFYYPDYQDVAESAVGYHYVGGGTQSPHVGLMFEDKGQGWWYYPVDNYIRSIDSYGDSTVFAVGDSGYVITNVDPALLSNPEQLLNEVNFKLYPNPANTQLNIELNGIEQSKVEGIVVYDMIGNKVLELEKYQEILDVSLLNKGQYVLQLSTGNGLITEKFLVR